MTGTGASPASRAAGSSPVRSGEFFAALSLATDLGTGQAAEHGLRTCLLALELAELAGLAPRQVEDTYYLGLLHSIGCTADAPVTARAFGDDRAHKAAYTLIDAGVHRRAGRRAGVRARESSQPL